MFWTSCGFVTISLAKSHKKSMCFSRVCYENCGFERNKNRKWLESICEFYLRPKLLPHTHTFYEFFTCGEWNEYFQSSADPWRWMQQSLLRWLYGRNTQSISDTFRTHFQQRTMDSEKCFACGIFDWCILHNVVVIPIDVSIYALHSSKVQHTHSWNEYSGKWYVFPAIICCK